MNKLIATEADRQRLIDEAVAAAEDVFAQRGLVLDPYQGFKLTSYMWMVLREIMVRETIAPEPETDDGH